MPDVGLHRLLRQEESLADLTVDQAVGHELENLDLASRRLLLELAERRRKRDHGAVAAAVSTRSRLVEPTTVVHVPAQDLFALCGVHGNTIGSQVEPL